MNKLKLLELFGGIGACSSALDRLNIDYEIVDYVEIDKYAVASYNAIHNTNFEPSDICDYDKDIQVDLIMHGSPCQDFSLAGKQAGGDKDSGTRSSLMYETLRIVEKLRPKYVIWENVKNLLSKKHIHNFNNYLDKMNELGYTNYYQVLNAKNYGIPQNRERVFTISIRDDINTQFVFPPKEELKLLLKDLLEDEVDEKYYLSEKGINYITAEKRLNNNWTNIDPNISIPLTAKGQSNWTGSFITVKNNTKKGYQEAYGGDSVNLSYPNSQTRRGRVGKEVAQTIQCNDSIGVVVNPMKTKNKRIIKLMNNIDVENQETLFMDIYNQSLSDNISGTLKGGMDHQQGNIIYNKLTIRKLTPKECWRLMGFTDEEFEKARQVNSDTQLYKQAGNSIVVNVLQKILYSLLGENK